MEGMERRGSGGWRGRLENDGWSPLVFSARLGNTQGRALPSSTQGRLLITHHHIWKMAVKWFVGISRRAGPFHTVARLHSVVSRHDSSLYVKIDCQMVQMDKAKGRAISHSGAPRRCRISNYCHRIRNCRRNGSGRGKEFLVDRAMWERSSKLVWKVVKKSLAKKTSIMNITTVSLTYLWFGGGLPYGQGDVVAIVKHECTDGTVSLEKNKWN